MTRLGNVLAWGLALSARYRERPSAEVNAVDRYVGSRSRVGAVTGGLVGLIAGVYFGAVLSSVSDTEVPFGTTLAVALIPTVVRTAYDFSSLTRRTPHAGSPRGNALPARRSGETTARCEP